MAAEISFRTTPPSIPAADFAFEIDFKRGEGSPTRVFSAIHDFIKTCERLDGELVSTIDSNIETVMVLEDIQVGSIKAWFRSILQSTDDEALKALDWRPAVGKYLVRAKYAVLRWVDDGKVPKSLPALAREIQKIASETDVRHLPDYRAPSPASLIDAIRDFQGVKDQLTPGDKAKFISSDGSVEMNLSVRFAMDDIEAMAVKESITLPPAQMIVAVKKPDYLGDSQWEVRHGKRNILATMNDKDWLRRFQRREIDVRPGDALKCEIQIENLYGHDNELLSERYTITRVIEVLPDTYKQTDLFEGS